MFDSRDSRVHTTTYNTIFMTIRWRQVYSWSGTHCLCHKFLSDSISGQDNWPANWPVGIPILLHGTRSLQLARAWRSHDSSRFSFDWQPKVVVIQRDEDSKQRHRLDYTPVIRFVDRDNLAKYFAILSVWIHSLQLLGVHCRSIETRHSYWSKFLQRKSESNTTTGNFDGIYPEH